jgi:hypothetical protein
VSGHVPVSPEEDTDAQDKIGNNTILGARGLLQRWNVRLYLGLDEESDVLSQEHTPFFGAGKLVELLIVVRFPAPPTSSRPTARTGLRVMERHPPRQCKGQSGGRYP